MRKFRLRKEAETEVDMTPMLDIVFIMLIFFIVTTSFVKENGIVIMRPAKNDNPLPTPDSQPIVIDINDNSEISIAGRFVDTNAIRANVETARAKSPQSIVVVRAHQLASVNSVISAVDQSRLAGVSNVTVVKPAS